jgi:hypothetical protein
MSELTDSVRKMLSQAQVFARDTPFEAVARARQAVQAIDAAIASAAPTERPELDALRELTVARVARYEERLEAWIQASRAREQAYNERERDFLQRSLRAKD